jgi:hypothetical protein
MGTHQQQKCNQFSENTRNLKLQHCPLRQADLNQFANQGIMGQICKEITPLGAC